MKKRLIVMFVFVSILSYALGAYANNPIKIIVNGKELHSDVPAQVINGRTMVPIRLVAEALGAEVNWDSATNSVLISSAQPPQNPEQQKLKIINNNSYRERDYLYVVGEVENNTGKTAKFVKIIATFYDKDDKMLDTDFTYCTPSTVTNDSKVPFKIMKNDANGKVYRYSLSIEWQS